MKLQHASWIAAPAIVLASAGAPAHQWDGQALFVMTNDADKNEIIAYQRTPNGTLDDVRHYRTEGRGSGGTIDPLASAGSLTLSTDRNWLFASNAGSGTVSAFAVDGASLYLADKVPSGGSEPNSIAQHGNLVYVLNTAAASSVVGFYFQWGHFYPIPDSIRYLSGVAVGSGSVAFSPNGHWLVVTEKATPSIDVFAVHGDGTLSPITVNKNVGAGTFSANFAPNGTLIVTETGVNGAVADSAVSSYAIQSDGTLKAITSSVPTLGAATCWAALSENGKFVYTSNSGTGTVSGFTVGSNGSLAPVTGTIVGTNPAGAINLDITVSGDGKFLYTLNAGTGDIGEFAVNAANGQLTNLGVQGHLPAKAGLNGIAAN